MCTHGFRSRASTCLRFIWAQPLERAAILADYTHYVAIIHPSNTSPKARDGWYWVRWPGDLRAIMGTDLDQYLTGAAAR